MVDRRGARGDIQRRHRGRLLRRGQLRGAAAEVGQRPASGRAGELLGRRRPSLHGPHQLGRDRDLADAEHDEVPEDTRDQRLLLGRRRIRALPLGHIQMLGKSDKDILRAGAPWFAPGLALDYIARHAIDFWMTTEDLPHPANRVTRGSRWPHPPEQDVPQPRAPQATAGQAQGAARPAGLPRRRDPRAGRSSTSGSRSPATPTSAARCASATTRPVSALDVDCRAHDLDNLYVVDTSFFPSSSAVNPALTAMANALRVGDHLLERLGATGDAATAPTRQQRARWRSCHERSGANGQQHRQGTGSRIRRDRRDDGVEHTRGQVARAGPQYRAGPSDREGPGHLVVRRTGSPKRASTISRTGVTAPGGV